MMGIPCPCSDRKFAVDQILMLRGESAYGDMSVRPRLTPKINMSEKTLIKLIPWTNVHEPVLPVPSHRRR